MNTYMRQILVKKIMLPLLKKQTLFYTIVLCLTFFPVCSYALALIDEAALDNITGQQGLSIAIANVEIFQHIETFAYEATDGGFIRFDNILVHDGNFGPHRYNFGSGNNGLIFYDIGTQKIASLQDWDANTDPEIAYNGMIRTAAPEWHQELAYFVGDITFADSINYPQGISLGSLNIGPIDMPSFTYYTGPHPDVGIDFQFNFEQHIETLSYLYQINGTNQKSLIMENLHFGQSFDYGLPGDDPTDPTIWKSDIGEFQVGDMYGEFDINGNPIEHSAPAQIDAGLVNIGGGLAEGSLRFRLPMSGSIRFENVDFGGTDFGPGAIDGLQVHRMDLYLIP